MNRTGIIYDIQKNSAVVLTSESEFVMVKKRRDMSIGQQVRFENRDVFSPNRRLLLNAVALAGVAAVLIVTFLCYRFFLPGNNWNVYGYIGVDINPSVEFEIKKNHRVLKMRPLNEEGKQLIRELDINDKKIEDAVSELIGKSIDMGFIESVDERIVLISGALKDEKSKESSGNDKEETRLYNLLNNIKSEIDNDRVEGHIILLGSQERKNALEKNIPMGKYGLYLEAEELKAGITFEDIYDMSVAEMIEKLNKIEPQESADVSNSENSPIPTPKHDIKTPKSEISTPPLSQKNDSVQEPTSIKTLTPNPTATHIDTRRPGTSELPTNTPVGTLEPTQKSMPTPMEVPAKGSLRIQYYSKADKEIVQGIDYSFRMFNTTSSVIDMRNVKVRYYFKEGVPINSMNSAIYFYSLGKEEDVHCKFYNLSGSDKANNYLEITFSSGSLSPDEILYITAMFYKNDWGEFDQSDDYSYNPMDTYVDWENMTAYINDVLVWGQEP
jgi:hypothetical protein